MALSRQAGVDYASFYVMQDVQLVYKDPLRPILILLMGFRPRELITILVWEQL